MGSGLAAGRGPAIFISYRRDDTAGFAGRLYDQLSERFGAARVFMDVDTIRPGQDFAAVLRSAVEGADVLLALIGPGWLGATAAADGSRRIDDPEDFVRVEIQAALDAGKLVIPVLVQGARMPVARDLPEALRPLAHRHALEISHSRFRADVDDLIEGLAPITSATPVAPPSAGTAPTMSAAPPGAVARTRNPRVLGAAAVGVVGIVVVALVAAQLSGAFGGGSSPSVSPSGSNTAVGPTASPAVTSTPAATSQPTGTPGATTAATPSGSPFVSPTPAPSPTQGPIATKDLPLVAYLDPETGAITKTDAPIPGQVENWYLDGGFWVLGLQPKALIRLDTTTHQVTNTVTSPLNDAWFTFADGTVWFSDMNAPRIVAVDVSTGATIHDFRFSDYTDSASGIAVGAGSVWVAIPFAGVVLRVDPDNGKVQATIKTDFRDTLWFGNGALYSTGSGNLKRIDPATNEVTFSTKLAPHFFEQVAFSNDAAWVADETDGTVWKVDRGGQIRGTYKAGLGARPIQVMDGTVWIGNQDDGTVTAIDADTGRIRTYAIGHQVSGLAAGNGQVMVLVNPSPDDAIDQLEGSKLTIAMNFDPAQPSDPATQFNAYYRMIQYATCARLLNYPDSSGNAGYELQPEVAAAMPSVSSDGRTYTFTVREGFAFSPPSNEPVTADTYRYSIERALSGTLGDRARGMDFLGDVEGAQAFHDGKTDHISGLVASGNTLTITLAAPSNDFLERLALPLFCPVPVRTPMVGELDPNPPIAASGPYYSYRHDGGELVILKQNPNYTGTRPRLYDNLVFRFGVAEGETVVRVDDGRADVAMADVAIQAGGEIARDWGPGSDHAKAGDQRWFQVMYPGIDTIVLNPNRKLLKDQDVRRAIAMALDRAALASTFFEVPGSQLLSPAFQVQDPLISELVGPNPTAALPLMHGKTGKLRFAINRDCDACRDMANVVKASLAPIGLTVELVEEDDPVSALLAPDSTIDLVNAYVQPFFPDPVTLLQDLLPSEASGLFVKPDLSARLAALADLTGRERLDAAASLAHDLVDSAVIIPFAFPPDGVYTSPGIGCQTVVPGVISMDLVTLCPT